MQIVYIVRMDSFSWVSLIGGLAFFFYGLQSIRNSLQLMAGSRIKATLGKATANRFKALAFGTFVTMILQSSSATTVMLVSLASTQMLTLPQAFGIILGADIGTTFVVILLSIKKISDYSLIIIAAGFAISSLAKRKRTGNIGSVILGFGLVFYGMHLMVDSTAPLKESTVALQTFSYLEGHPLALLIIAAIFTAFIHASAATIGMAISLSFAGLITFESAIPIVLGANVGTCFTALLACFGMGIDGRRVAVAHILVKVVGAAIAFPFIKEIATGVDIASVHLSQIIPHLAPGDGGKIAITHLLFNVAIALIFLPFIKLGVRTVEKIVPAQYDEKEPFQPRYLDEKLLDTPLLAFAQVKREIIRVAGYGIDLFKDCLMMFERSGHVPEIIEDLQSRDDKIDILDGAIRFYLAKLSQEHLSGEQAEAQYQLFNIAGNLEEIGDIISKDLALLAEKKWNTKITFSDEGWKELRNFHAVVMENFNLTIDAISSPHPEIVQKIIRHQKLVYDLEQQYQQAHMNRLHEGMKESFESSSIHLDVLSNLRRVNGQLTYIAKVVSDKLY